MAKRRRFTAEFKASVVLEALSGESSQAELLSEQYMDRSQFLAVRRNTLLFRCQWSK